MPLNSDETPLGHGNARLRVGGRGVIPHNVLDGLKSPFLHKIVSLLFTINFLLTITNLNNKLTVLWGGVDYLKAFN